MSLLMILMALLLGAGVGVLTGLFGVGGGFMITPLLNVVLGISMPIAVGTSAIQIVGVSTSGLFRRRSSQITDLKLALVLFGGILVGTRLGAHTVRWLQDLEALSIHGQSVPAVDFWLLWVFVVLLGAIATWMFYDTRHAKSRSEGQPGLLTRIRIPPYTHLESLDASVSLVALGYLGLFLGFLTGLLGIGGGVIMLPVLVYLLGMNTHQAAATSMALVWLSGVTAVVNHAAAGNTNLILSIPLLVGGSIGVQFGISLADRLGGATLRRYFGYVVLLAVVMVAIKLGGILL